MRYALPLLLLVVLAVAGCDGGGTGDPTPFDPGGTWVSVTPIDVDTTLADGREITASGSHAVSMTVGADTTYHITQAGTVSILSPEGAARGGIDLALDLTIRGFVGATATTVTFLSREDDVPVGSLTFQRVSDDELRGNTAILYESAGEMVRVPIDVPITLRR